MDVINNYRSREIGGRYFVTTDHGSFAVLDKDEFTRLKNLNIDDRLRKKLEKKEIILNESTANETIRLLSRRNSFLFQGTSLHIIVVTLRCNMNCIYCHASSKGMEEEDYDMDIETAKKTVDFIFQTPSNNIKIEFQGGEPLLNWDTIKAVIQYAHEKNRTAKKDMLLTVVTNMAAMDDEKMNYLLDNEVEICTSLDGPKELHDFNRKYARRSNHDQVVEWIKKIQQELKNRKSRMRVNALVTLTRKSLDYPKEIVDEYVRLGLQTIHLRFLNNLGVASRTWDKISYSVDEYLDFWKKAVRYIDKLNKEGNDIHEYIIKIMKNKIGTDLDPNFLEMRTPCGAVTGQLTYNHNGDIYTCDEARMIGEDLFMLGNVAKDDYAKVVTCDKSCIVINASINDQYMCDNCAFKPYCGICPVCNYAEQGTIIGKISQTDRCKIFMEQFTWVVEHNFMDVAGTEKNIAGKRKVL